MPQTDFVPTAFSIIKPDRFADLIPDQHFDLTALRSGPAKSNALDEIYGNQFNGCFLETDSYPMGDAAKFYEDEFKDVAGRNTYSFSRIYNDVDSLMTEETKFGYSASKCAYECFAKEKDQRAIDWLFKTVQNSGICVGSSGVEMIHGMLGTRAKMANFNEQYKWLAAQWAYAFRGSCGQGWYMGAHASVTKQHGYCFALPDINGVPYLSEDDSERLVTSNWCRGGPPSNMRQYVIDNKWFFQDNAIVKFDVSMDGLKKMFQCRGQLHHGSNHTSSSGTPNRLKRIGGHAQTAFGGFWDEKTLKFYRDKGINYTENDFPVLNHQSWGGSWGGEVSDNYWPEWFGPKPQGTWICSSKQILQYFSGSYVYFPLMVGFPSDTPKPGPGPAPGPVPILPELESNIYTEDYSAIRGDVMIPINTDPNAKKYPYVVGKNIARGSYKLIPKPSF